MPTDTERREVARRLRESAGNGEVLRDVFLEEILAGDIGLWFAEDIEIDTLLYHLADLIEPSCDCDALLALAEEIERTADFDTGIDPRVLFSFSRRIRKALGVEK